MPYERMLSGSCKQRKADGAVFGTFLVAVVFLAFGVLGFVAFVVAAFLAATFLAAGVFEGAF